MDAFTIALFTVILICILGGIGCGFHLAFRLADGQSEKRPTKGTEGSDTPKAKKAWLNRPSKKQDKNHLSQKIHRQDDSSFQEFSCQFTGENPKEKLESARRKQDSSYNCLNQEEQAQS